MKTTLALPWALQLVTATSPVINTSSGCVVGHSAHQEPGVTEYLGIPYAKPPLGELRFTPPQKLTSTAIIAGHEFVSAFHSKFWYIN
jgi:carboxylesterase type B